MGSLQTAVKSLVSAGPFSFLLDEVLLWLVYAYHVDDLVATHHK